MPPYIPPTTPNYVYTCSTFQPNIALICTDFFDNDKKRYQAIIAEHWLKLSHLRFIARQK